jgi:hypothetical protein
MGLVIDEGVDQVVAVQRDEGMGRHVGLQMKGEDSDMVATGTQR